MPDYKHVNYFLRNDYLGSDLNTLRLMNRWPPKRCWNFGIPGKGKGIILQFYFGYLHYSSSHYYCF